jgi:DNA-binding response OmpR family regulator
MNNAITLPERDREHERVLGIVFNISPAQASVLSCLTRGTVATSEELLAYSGVKSFIKVVVSRTRAKLKEYGFDIKSKMEVGYWIEAEDRKAIEWMVKEFMEGK